MARAHADGDMSGEPANEPISLANCDQEPIHIPGAIQPHGVLLAMSQPELRVRHASASTLAHLGVEASELLGRELDAALDDESMSLLRRVRESSVLHDENPLKLRGRRGAQLFDGIL